MTRYDRFICLFVILLNISSGLLAQDWSKAYDFGPNDTWLDVQHNADGGYMVLTASPLPDGASRNIRLTRITPIGNLISSHTLSYLNADSLASFMPMIRKPGGGFFLYGQSQQWENDPRLYQFEINTAGVLVSADSFLFPGYKGLVFTKNTADAAGNFYASGQYWQSGPSDTLGYNICLIKGNNAGELIWTRRLSFASEPDRQEKFLTLDIDHSGGVSADWQQNFWFDNVPSHRLIRLDAEGNLSSSSGFDVDEAAYYPEVQWRDSFFIYSMGQELNSPDPGVQRRLMKIGPDGAEISRRYFPMAPNTEWELSVASRDFLLLAETTINEDQDQTRVVYQLIDKSTLRVVWSQTESRNAVLRLQKILFSGQDSFLLAYQSYPDAPDLAETDLLLEKLYVPSQNLVNLLSGHVVADLDGDCAYDATDAALAQFIVKAEKNGAAYYALSDSSGYYAMQLDTGVYTLSIHPPGLYWAPCLPDTVLQLETGDSLRLDFPSGALTQCPYMEVNMSVDRLRRCFDNTLFVSYSNKGTQAVSEAWVELTLDAYLQLTGASIPYTSLGGNRWRFEVGALAPFESGSLTATVHVECDSTVLGQTHCMEAHIFPDTICLPDSAWSGAEISVDIRCANDSVYIVITNIGDAPTSAPCEYIVIEDDVILKIGEILLNPGDSLTFVYPANGSFWRIEASQEPDFPYLSMPSASMEGCGGFEHNSLGLFPAYPQDDASFLLDIDCVQNVGSLESNSILGFPLGVGPDNYIYPNIDLEYMIHFQNTGSDTAFTVEIIDTLPPVLVASALTPGASSHAYTWDISGPGILKLRFEDIRLPDSSASALMSQGFVEFRIAQAPELPEETLIANRAWVNYDFNEAVPTAYARHTVRRVFLTVAAWEPSAPGRQLRVYPNPVQAGARLYLDGENAGALLMLQIFDAQGRPAVRTESADGYFDVDRQHLRPGLYFFRITSASGKWIGSGKLTVY